jgi:hypothetical protein
VLLPALLTAGSLAAAGPASADVTGSTSTGDVVLYSHCQRHAISYDLHVSPGTAQWSVELQVFDPDGIGSEGTVVSSTTGSPTSGTVDKTFCGSETAGTWTVRATGFYELLPAVRVPVALPETRFSVRPVATRTRLTVKALGHHRYRLTTRVGEETEHGFARSNGVRVRLERLAHGTWTKVRGSSSTTVHGRDRVTLHGRPGTTLRAVVPARSNYAASTSPEVTL